MRGKGTVEKDGEPWFGITPAYAGKSAGDYPRNCTAKDHPRLCGEKDLLICPVYDRICQRFGLQHATLYKLPPVVVIGITPAYAGKS